MSTATAATKLKQTVHSPRLSREDWLTKALEYLAHEGSGKLTIDSLVSALGVTKGSFYWHFRDREDFQRGLIDYWDRRFTQTVVDQVNTMADDPAERLWAIMKIVCNNKLARYDVAVRAWVAEDKLLAPLVRKVDKLRLGFVRDLFQRLSFQGDDLEMRTRSFVTYVSLEPGISVKQSHRQRLESFWRFHALITAR